MNILVSKQTVESAILDFMTQAISTMPTSLHKFLLGGAIGVINKPNSVMSQMLSAVSNSEGLIDITKLRAMSDNAFRASGGQIQVTLFRNQSPILGSILQPVTLTISKADVDALLDKLIPGDTPSNMNIADINK